MIFFLFISKKNKKEKLKLMENYYEYKTKIFNPIYEYQCIVKGLSSSNCEWPHFNDEMTESLIMSIMETEKKETEKE